VVPLLVIGAVAVGLGFQIPNAANLHGYAAEILDHGLTGGYGDVRVRPARGERLADGEALAAQARAVPGVAAAVPALMTPASVQREGRFVSLPLIGIDAGARRRPYRPHQGSDLAPGDRQGVLLGSTAAGKLGVEVGDEVTVRALIARGPRLVLDDGGVGQYRMTVRGIVGGNFGSYEGAFVDRPFLASELGDELGASILFVYTDDHFAAPALAARLQGQLPGVVARDWLQDAPFLAASIGSGRTIARVSESMVMMAVAVPVLALFYILALTWRRQIAILSAVGFSRGDVFGVFLLHAGLLAVVGIAVGLLMGAGLVRWFQHHPIFRWDTFVVVPRLDAGLVLRNVAVVFATTVAAGLFPAWRASATDAATALREVD
jgi:ABC-type lipoprotein release transport system permease subunit